MQRMTGFIRTVNSETLHRKCAFKIDATIKAVPSGMHAGPNPQWLLVLISVILHQGGSMEANVENVPFTWEGGIVDILCRVLLLWLLLLFLTSWT